MKKSADRYGDRDVIPASVAREIETQLAQWVEAADQSQQPQAFYDGYSEAQMRAMQAMFTNAKTDAEDQAKWAKHYSDRCDKLAEQLAECAGALVVCLVPARTDTAWWHDYAMRGTVRFIRGRLKFAGHHKDAPFPSALVVFNSQNVKGDPRP